MTQPPKRLLESAELSGPARRLLELGRVQAPVSYDVGAGAERFQAALAIAAASGSVAQPSRAAGGGAKLSALKLGKLCLLLSPAIVGATVMLGPWRQARAPRPAAVTQSSVEVPASAAASPSPLPPEPSSPADVGAPVVAPAPEPAAASGGDASARRDSKAPRPGVTGARAATAHSFRHQRAGDRNHLESYAHEVGLDIAASKRSTRSVSSQRGRRAASDSSRTAAVSSERALSSGSAPVAAASSASSASSAHAAVSSEVRRVPQTTDSMGELEGLARARSLVRQEPRAAVELLERLAREHAHSYFVEEREALYVIALAEDNQHSKASQLAAAFLRKYPASPLAGSVRSAVDR